MAKTGRIHATGRRLLIRFDSDSIKSSFQRVKGRVKRGSTWRRPFHQQAYEPSPFGAHHKRQEMKVGGVPGLRLCGGSQRLVELQLGRSAQVLHGNVSWV